MKKYYANINVKGEVVPFGLKEGESYLVVVEGSNISFLYSNGDLKAKQFNNSLTVDDVLTYEKQSALLELTEAQAKIMLGPVKALRLNYKFAELEAAFNRIDENRKSFVVESNLDKNSFAAPSKSPLLFRHSRFYHKDGSVRGNGGFSFGIIINYDNNWLEVYPAICEDSDTFSKHLGIAIVKHRHRVGDGFKVLYSDGTSLLKNIEYGLQDTFDVSHYDIVAPLIRRLGEYFDF